jgi:hypothetical protein
MATYRVPILEQFSWQPPVLATQNAPPGAPVKGDRYIVAGTPSGAWVGYAWYIATYTGSGWLFDQPTEGWRAYDINANDDKYFNGTVWLAMPPSSHASSHQSGGGDAIKLDDLAVTDDNTDLNATTSAHGLLNKLGGGTTNFLRADGAWAAPGAGGDMTKAVYDTDADNIVDKAEAVDDGAGNATTAAQVKEAYTKRAVYDADYKCLTFTI